MRSMRSLYIDSKLEAAADERRHDTHVHFAVAMSVHDFVSEVAKLCPDNTPVPLRSGSICSSDPTKLSSLHYTGRFILKFIT